MVAVPSGTRNTPASAVLAVNPADGVTVIVRKSVKPPKLVKVIVEVPVVLGGVDIEAGVDVTPKSVRLENVAP